MANYAFAHHFVKEKVWLRFGTFIFHFALLTYVCTFVSMYKYKKVPIVGC